MALEKTTMPLNVSRAANQKTDPQTLEPGTPTILKNARFTKGNRLDKRYGYGVLTMEDQVAATITDTKKIIGTDEHLLMWAGDKAYSYNSAADDWTDKGRYYSCESRIRSVDESAGYILMHDSVTVGNFSYYVYSFEKLSTTDPVLFQVIDDTTNETVVKKNLDATIGATWLRMFEFSGIPYLLFSEGSSLKGQRLGGTYTDYMDTAVTLCSDIKFVPASRSNWSIYNWGPDTRIILAYNDSGVATTLNIRYFDSALTELTGSYALYQETGMTSVPDFINIAESSIGTKFHVRTTLKNATSGLLVMNDDGTKHAVQTSAAGPSTSGTDITVSTVYAVHGFPQSWVDPSVVTHEGTQWFFAGRGNKYTGDVGTYQMHAADSAAQHTQGGGSDTGQVSGNIFETFWDMRCISRDQLYNSNRYWVFLRPVENATAFFLVTIKSQYLYIVSQVLYGRSIDLNSDGPLIDDLHFSQASTGKLRMALPARDSATQLTSLVSIEFDFTSSELFTGVSYGRSLLIAGTNINSYCGHYVRELGFFYPPKVSVTVTQGSNGLLTDGVYSFLFVYEYTDKNGLVHRSAPGPAYSITISASGGTGSIDCRVAQYTNSNLLPDTSANNLVQIIPYRTVVDGSIYYRETYYDDWASGTGTPDLHDNTSYLETSTFSLELSDIELEVNAVLYTDAGEIPPAPIPPVKYLTTWANRVWAGGTARDEAIFYSKLSQANLAPELSEVLSVNIQDLPGDVTGLKGFTDKIIMTKRGRLYYSYGDGPDNTGQNGSFALFEAVHGVSGVVNGASINVDSRGMHYKSDKGMYLLSNGLDIQYSGALFEDQADTDIIKVLSPIDSETMRIITAAGIIEEDLYFNAWTFQDGLTPVDACIYNNTFHLLADDDVVYKENRTVWKDNATAYALSLETGWISFGGVNGFQRFYKLFMKLTYKSVHTLKISLAYDYGAYQDDVTLDPANAIDDDVYRFTVYPTTQKCEAFRIKIEEIILDGTAGTHESLQLNFMGVQVGVKRGLPRLKAAQKQGVSTI